MPKLRFVITVHTCAGLSFVPMGMLGGWEIRESFPQVALMVKNPHVNAGDEFHLWVGKIP